MKGVEQQLDEEVVTMNGKVEMLKVQLKSNREETTAVEKKIDQTRNEIAMIHESIMRMKEEVINQVTAIDEDLHNQLANVRINLNSVNEKHQTSSMRVANHSDELDNHRKMLEEHNHELKSIDITLKNLREIKLNKDIYDKEIARVISETQKLAFGQQDLHRNLQATDNYLEKYFPITLQNYITETLSNVIDNKKILGRLLKYDIQVYKSLHQIILDDEGYPSLNKQEYHILDMDTIRRKIAMIEDQEIKDDSDFLPSEYSTKKSPAKRKKRSKASGNDDQSVTSHASGSRLNTDRDRGTKSR